MERESDSHCEGNKIERQVIVVWCHHAWEEEIEQEEKDFCVQSVSRLGRANAKKGITCQNEKDPQIKRTSNNRGGAFSLGSADSNVSARPAKKKCLLILVRPTYGDFPYFSSSSEESASPPLTSTCQIKKRRQSKETRGWKKGGGERRSGKEKEALI